MAILKLTAAGGDVERELPTEDASVTLGRAEENEWPLEDEAASRRHAVITSTPEGHVIKDLGSSNGTWVNRTRIETHLLVDGDEIRIGASTFVFSQPQIDDATVMVDMANLPNAAPAPHAPAAPSPPPAPAPPPAQAPPPPPAPAPAPPVGGPAGPPPVEPPASAVMAQQDQRGTGRPVAASSARRSPAAASWQQKAGGVFDRYTSWLAAPPATPTADAGESAGFVIRLGAYLIDSVILCAAMILVMVPIGAVSALIGSKIGFIGMLLSLFGWLLSMVIGFGYLLVPWALVGVTPGKKILGLKIVRSDGSEPLGYLKAALRMVGYMASGAVFCVGFIMVAFTKDHKGLHDMIADTKVVKT
jgi:uncharacterized RDD family membrane protein YckC